MLSFKETVRMSVTVLNVKIQQNGKTLGCNNTLIRSLDTTTTISYN